MKKQVILIHGGSAFDSYEEYLRFLKGCELNFNNLKIKKWKETLEERLSDGFEVISLQMPNKNNAKYLEWKIWFDKHIPYFNNEVILVGHSMGGIFLAKYLSENDFPKKVIATLLIAAPFDEKDLDEKLVDFKLSNNLNLLEQQGGKVILYHSKDDPVVPYVDVEKYKNVIPLAEIKVFEDRGHFSIVEFPELVEDIQNLFK